jgi:phosphoserine aminotransferase
MEGTIARTRANAAALYAWIERTPWVEPLAVDPATRSQTSVAMRFVEPDVLALSESHGLVLLRDLVRLLEAEQAAFDIAAYRGMPLGLRIWCGATVETADILNLLPWLEWAYAEARRKSEPEGP